jgi:hypothetical protein
MSSIIRKWRNFISSLYLDNPDEVTCDGGMEMSEPLKKLHFKCLTISKVKLAIVAYCLPLAVGQSTWNECIRTAGIFMK